MGNFISYFYETPIFYFGWKPDEKKTTDKILVVPSRCYKKLPTCVDLRQSSNILLPFYQGPLDSCTSNAICWIITYQKIVEDVVPSRLFVYYNERYLFNNNVKENCSDDVVGSTVQGSTIQGSTIRDTIITINKYGIVDEKEFPCDFSNEKYITLTKPDEKIYNNSLKNIIKYQRVQVHPDNRNINDLKVCLHKGYPIIFGFDVYESFLSDSTLTTGVVKLPEKEEKIIGHQCAIIIGYNDIDNICIVRNSWGTNIGDQGDFYFGYEYIKNNNLCKDFWIIDKK